MVEVEPDKENVYDVIIIGGGPAGINAGIYAVRRNLKTLIIESQMMGGTVNITSTIENYLGFPSISGPELVNRFVEHLNSVNVPYVISRVLRAEKQGDIFIIRTHDDRVFKSKTIILATGSRHKALNVPGEDEFTGRGVSYCTTCDAPLYRGKTVGVVGGGDSAFRAAELLSSIASKVYLIHRREGFRAEDVLVERVKRMPNVEFKLNKVVTEIIGDEVMRKVKLKDTKTGEESYLELDGLFINIGEVPSHKIATDLGAEVDEHNYVKVDRKTMATTVDGLYAAGDVTGTLAQIIVAAAEGAIAAISAYKYVKELDTKKK